MCPVCKSFKKYNCKLGGVLLVEFYLFNLYTYSFP